MIQSKIALVTGGSRGLGKQMAIELSKKGIDVIITYFSNKAAAEEVISDIKKNGQNGAAFQLDTSNIDYFNDFTIKLSAYLLKNYTKDKIDFLINNAGTGIYKPFLETTENQFDEMINIHFKGVYFLTQKIIPLINEGGKIINISSGLTRFSIPNSSVYASAKAAIEVFTKYLAKELSDKKITANVVAPGAIATDFGGGENKNNQQKINTIANFTALGRMGKPGDIGGIIAFLCSNDATWINGQRIEASGGIML